jgi:glutaminyl-tRNA synthetase
MAKHFIAEIIENDLASGKHASIRTRFPPEPNGYLHLGHAKSICLNFGLAAEYGGLCNLRFDDTNPTKEEAEYVESIQRDVRWLGFDWEERCYYASDYFGRLYEWAEQLVRDGKAYVDDLSVDEIRDYRGPWNEPGRESPFRNRPVEENLDLFRRMRAGEFPDGTRVLRAKIDMSSGNINLRDPVMYRILHAHHHRTGDAWCIYPMYDWAHGQSDSLERITHSICTLEFEDHRPLYDWFVEALGIYPPRQIEFARLNVTHTVLSKRKLLRLVQESVVSGWDDPRMPTLAGIRRRGYPPAALRDFCERIGVTKQESVVEFALLEHCVREELNRTAPRRMAVLKPLKLVLTDWDAGRVEALEAVNNPEDPAAGTRPVRMTRELWIERDDFMEEPPKKFHRLAPGREVRLRWGYIVRCDEVVKDAAGEVVELRCSHDPATRGGGTPDGRKVPGTIHWVSAAEAIDAEVRLYDHLFANPDPDDVPEGVDWIATVNPGSLEVVAGAKVEPAAAALAPGANLQFERIGYFTADAADHRTERPVFNRTATLRDSWAKAQKQGAAGG